MWLTAARYALTVLLSAAAGSANADEAQQAAACMERDVFAEAVACLAGVAPDRACSSAEVGPFAPLLPGRVALRFGERSRHGTISKGVVLQGSSSAAVRSPTSGIVLYVGPFRTYASLIVLEASCELRFVIAGVETFAVAAGDTISASQILGHLPASGPESSPALVVELHKSGKQVDPGPAIVGR